MHLFFLAHQFVTRSGGVSTHVDDATAFSQNLLCTLGYLLLGLLAAIGIEGVGRAVQDAHHYRLCQAHLNTPHFHAVFHTDCKDTKNREQNKIKLFIFYAEMEYLRHFMSKIVQKSD